MLPFGARVPAAIERTLLVSLVGMLTVAAWLALWLAESSDSGSLHHHHLGSSHAASGQPAVLFVFSWAVMTVAMMLPTSLPILTILHGIARQRQDRWFLVALAIAGYVVTWVLFGVIVYFLGGWLLQLIARVSFLSNQLWAAPGLLLLTAGAFQFSSLKYRCLDKCRSPLSSVMEHWQGDRHRWRSFHLGVSNGMFCVGCCWALMLLMFAVGVGSLGWMLILAVVMAVEKNVSWGRRMGKPVGAVLLVWGIALLWLR